MSSASQVTHTQGAQPTGGSPDSSRLFQKLLITVVVGGIVYVLTNVLKPEQNEVWKLVLSVLVSGAVLIVQYMFTFAQQLTDLKADLARHNHEMREVIDKSFARISEATELFSEVEVLRKDGVPQLASSATKVVAMAPEIMRTFARGEISRLAALMDDLTDRSADCPGENNDWLLGLTKCAQETIDAISTSVDRDFWSSEPAGRYLLAQRDAIEMRGVKVRRLFIVEKREDIDDLAQLRREQEELDIDVRVVVLSDLSPNIRRGTTNDFIIFDGTMCYEVDPDPYHVNARTTLNSREQHVNERIQRFNKLWDAVQAPEPSADPE
ncbi:hypothetical protein ACIP79_30520 [Streptomyces sp. NPDC088747]|uniref:hypothetical protein n=1 Tax=Streptomyces sp. NPDC088747 TaxID=3365886 RepID=UPI00380C7B6A